MQKLKPKAPINMPRLKIEIEDISSLEVLMAPNPNSDIVEDRRKADLYLKTDIPIIGARIEKVINFIEEAQAIERHVFFHQYPPLSKVYMVVLLAFIWSFDARYLLSYISGFIFVIFSTGHEKMKKHFDPFL